MGEVAPQGDGEGLRLTLSPADAGALPWGEPYWLPKTT